VRRNREALTLRIAAWGRSHGHPVGKLKAIRYLTVAHRNPFGRPTVFVIEADAGPRYRLPAESFRVACNFTAEGLPDRGPRLKSAFFEVVRRGEQIEFSDAHGFGHGVGLCQFGAQAMAEHGHDVMAILETYYPGALVERAY
jgi:stage II sporulation protein D